MCVLVFVCWRCSLSVSDLTVERWCYRHCGFTRSAVERLKDKRSGGGTERKGRGAWVTYLLMLPLLHNPLLSNGEKMLMRPWSRTMEDGEEEEKKNTGRKDCPLLWCINVNSWQGRHPFLYQVCEVWLDQQSDEKQQRPKALFESLNKQSAIVFFVNMQLLQCTCGKNSQGKGCSSLLHRKNNPLPISNWLLMCKKRVMY